MSPARRVAVVGAALVAASVAGLWQQATFSASASPRLECARAGLVDGQLRCEHELPTEPALVCPGEGPRAEARVAPGDALDTARLCVQAVAHPGGPGWSRMSPLELAALEQPVELNRADEDELTSLPRVGPVIARRIVEGRPYSEVDDLLRVRGIGPVTLERLRPRVRVQPVASSSRP